MAVSNGQRKATTGKCGRQIQNTVKPHAGFINGVLLAVHVDVAESKRLDQRIHSLAIIAQRLEKV